MSSKYYIFENPKDIDYELFRKKCLQHNRETSTIISIAILVLFIVLHVIWFFFDFSKDLPQEVYFKTNLRILAGIALIVISYNFSFKKFKFREREYLTQFFIILLSFAVLSISCINAFVISLNPKNNLTPVLIGAIATSALFRFNVLESLFVYLMAILLFASLFIIWSDSQIKFALNFSVVFNIYLLSFVINRIIFSNSFRYFKQLRATESINITLRNAIKQKDEVLEIVAHDLRGPINNVKEIASLMNQPEISKEELNNYLPLITDSCQNAESVINELLSIARIKNTSEPIETVCINDVVKDIYTNSVKNNPSRQLIFADYYQKLYSKIYPDKFKRILLNLISNSLKFTPDNKKITIKIYDNSTHNILDIVDEGIGIDKEQQQQLFKKFSGASKTGLKGEESVGLGLYIVKELTSLMDGEITYQSNDSIGSTFRISLPKNA